MSAFNSIDDARIQPKVQVKREGDNAYIVCLVYNVRYITWLFNEVRPLPLNVIEYNNYSNITAVLWIRDVEQNNGGYYECIEQRFHYIIPEDYHSSATSLLKIAGKAVK